MISADALIRAVQLRMQVARRWLRPPGELPTGWQQWFDAMGERVGAVTGASAEDIVAVLMQRPLAVAPGRAAELGRWQAFSTLWRQEWHAQESADERRWHWLAASLTGCWHLFLAGMLAWLMYLELINAAHPPPKGEEMVVQIEYVGDGTPEDVGGGPEPETTEPMEAVEPIEPMEAAEPSEAASRSETTMPAPEPSPRPFPSPDVPVLPPTVSAPTLQSPPPELVEREVPQTTPPEVAQPLTVSEPVPDRSETFVLPPPTPRIDAPALQMPELSAPSPALEIVEIPRPQPRVPRPSVQPIAQPRITQPVLQPKPAEVIVRDVPAPEVPTPPRAVVPVLAPTRPDAPKLEAVVPRVRVREIPSPPRPVATAPAKPAPTPAAEPRSALEVAPTEVEPVATAGPEETPAPGAWPTPERADDWGAAARERPGAQKGEPPGLYDSDGSVRLAQTPGSASPGLPPGTITEEIDDLDRAGTWLRRPPNDYEPTAFAEYWRPNETLLEEWVRKSVTTIRIPIPGTTKYIECTTVMLVMGGACGIGDPNLNEQPPTARPPPDIPFKPELQKGNGSAPPPAG
ncbi:hypothetical protein [Novilysobacter erysipheiresistens]|uniref:Transmembrane repetitive protein n=1 Tax=Novilysobacter erysipheiresistens TaxID=1749332 RepID=A0ABU7YVI1_9GAMM